MDKGWMMILIAGLAEVVWAVAMGYSDGFTVWYYDVITVVFLIISTVLLERALRTGIPVGTAYAVWTGIGAVGTIIVSVALGNETICQRILEESVRCNPSSLAKKNDRPRIGF